MFHSSSSWTSNRVGSRLSIRSDSESLEQQLDRLNFTLQGFMKHDEKDAGDSFSYKGLESINTEEDFIEKFEGFIQKHDRALMLNEDFRSHLMKEQDSEAVIGTLEELYGVKRSIENKIKCFEMGLKQQAVIEMPGKSILWILKEGTAMGQKKEVLKQVENGIDEGLEKEYLIKDFDWEKRFEFLKEIKVYDEICSSASALPQLYVPKDLRTQFSLEIEYKTLKNSNKLKEKNNREVEWQILQTKMMKNNLDSKAKSLNAKELNITKQVKDIKLEVSKQQSIIEKDRKSWSDQQAKLKNQEKNLEKVLIECEKLKKPQIQIDEPVFKNSTNLTPRHQIQNFDDIQKIEQEIRSLTENLENSSDKHPLMFKINHLKTKLSTLRSTQALNNQNKRRVSSFSKEKVALLTPRTGKHPDFIPCTPRIQNFTATNFNPFEMSDSRNFTDRSLETEGSNKQEIKENLLELKESRLRKKEQELIVREEKMMKNWAAVKGNENILLVLKDNLEYWKEKNKEWTEKEINFQELEGQKAALERNLNTCRIQLEQANEEMLEKMKSYEKVMKMIKEMKRCGGSL